MSPLRYLLVSSTIFTCIVAAHGQELPQDAASQSGQGGESVRGSLDDIVVTARRRAEVQQDVPIAITTLTGDTLAKKGVTDLIQLSRQAPNVIIAGGSTNPQLLTIGIRGIRQKEPHIYFENSASIIYNQTVLAQPIGIGEQMYDLADVQILKGPQGTLFGRNSTAGALVITPKLASVSDGFSGSAIASLGDYNLRRVQGVLNIPLSSNMAIRFAGEHRQRDGYMVNAMNGDRWNDVNTDSFRVSLTWEPSDTVRNYLAGDYLHSSTAPAAIIQVDFLNGGSGNLLGGTAESARYLAEQRARGTWSFASEAGTGSANDLLRPANCTAAGGRPFQTICNPANINAAFKMQVWGINDRLEWDVADNLTIKNILAYRSFTRSTYQSSWVAGSTTGASFPGNQSITQSPSPVVTFSEELNLTGKALGSKLDYSVGLFYLENKGTETNISFQAVGSAGTTGLNIAPTYIKLKAYGVYAQGTFAVTDRFNITGGIRYNRDEKYAHRQDTTVDVLTGAVTCNIFVGTGSTRLPTDNCTLQGNKAWEAITWLGSADYKIFDKTLLYASVSRGYRAGSFFPRANRESLFSYNPEYVTSYEAGIKSEWYLGNMPVRTNLAVYRADSSNMQVQVQDPTTTPLSGFINNAGKARFQGGELELTLRPTKNFTLNGFASYTDFKYSQYFDGINDLAYQTTPNPISPWVVGGSADLAIPLNGAGELNLRADATWNEAVVTDNRFPNLKGDWPQPAYTIVNARADWNNIFDSKFSLGVFVTNLTNEFYSNGGTCLSGICSIVPSPPRMWGVDMSVKF